jgi:hypothetical protein
MASSTASNVARMDVIELPKNIGAISPFVCKLPDGILYHKTRFRESKQRHIFHLFAKSFPPIKEIFLHVPGNDSFLLSLPP